MSHGSTCAEQIKPGACVASWSIVLAFLGGLGLGGLLSSPVPPDLGSWPLPWGVAGKRRPVPLGTETSISSAILFLMHSGAAEASKCLYYF